MPSTGVARRPSVRQACGLRPLADDTRIPFGFAALIRIVLQEHRVPAQDMAGAIADVRLEPIEAAHTRAMPRDLARWKALATTTALHWALDRHRRARQRGKYDTGHCEDPDSI
jgi:hypothetical protein